MGIIEKEQDHVTFRWKGVPSGIDGVTVLQVIQLKHTPITHVSLALCRVFCRLFRRCKQEEEKTCQESIAQKHAHLQELISQVHLSRASSCFQL
jgi:hypothetical protein